MRGAAGDRRGPWGPGGAGRRWPGRAGRLAFAVAAALAVLGPAPAAPQGGAPSRGLDCSLCHGDLELLSQRAGGLERARRLHVPLPGLRSSAHGEMACTRCHEGFDAYPHPERGGRTAACGSCHAGADSAWAAGAHAPSADGPPSGRDAAPAESSPARGTPEEGARCAACHGVHDVRPASELGEPAGIELLNGRCVGCHATARLPAGAPHADSVACHACHRPHDTGHVGTSAAATAPARQAGTCGSCHEEISGGWTEDVHGAAVLDAEDGTAERGGEPEREPPACTTCHGSHGMVDFASPSRPGGEASRCDDCHEEYADTFGDSYHGQAVSLGSPAAASCADCHTAHAVHPASDPRSSVAEGDLVETCGECHPDATASFVEFQPHADPHDRGKNPVLYWSYKFMTWLLIGVISVFGLHTLLWLLRLGVERWRGGGGVPGGGGRGEGP